METRLDSFTGRSIDSSTQQLLVYLLDASGNYIPNSKQTIDFTSTVKSWRELIALEIDGGATSPYTLPEGAVACYYKVLTSPGIYLGRNAVFGIATPVINDSSTVPNGLEALLYGEEGFLGHVRR